MRRIAGLTTHQWSIVLITLLPFLLVSIVWGKNSPQQPYFNKSATNVTFNVGDLAILTCSVENLGSRHVVWRKASEPHPLTIGSMTYVGDPRIRATKDNYRRIWKLLISNVQSRDAGVYECQISSKSNAIRLILLRVNDNPAAFPEPAIKMSGKTVIDKGQPLRLVCNASGGQDLARGIDWFKDSDPIDANVLGTVSVTSRVNKHSYSLLSILEVKRAASRDTGTYVCRSSEGVTDQAAVVVLNNANVNYRREGSHDPQTGRGTSSPSSRPMCSICSMTVTLLCTMWLAIFYPNTYNHNTDR